VHADNGEVLAGAAGYRFPHEGVTMATVHADSDVSLSDHLADQRRMQQCLRALSWGDEEVPADRFAREPLGYQAGIRSTCVQQGQVFNPANLTESPHSPCL
jgi:hypothetical protein